MGGPLSSSSFTCAECSARGSCVVPEPLTVGGSPSVTLVTIPVRRLSCLVVTGVIVKVRLSATASRMLFGSVTSAPRGETEAQGEGTQPWGRLLCGLGGLAHALRGALNSDPADSRVVCSVTTPDVPDGFYCHWQEAFFRAAQCSQGAQPSVHLSATPVSALSVPLTSVLGSVWVLLFSLGPCVCSGKWV